MAGRTGFPVCTERGCRHAGNEPVDVPRKVETVSDTGRAVCTCHPKEVADRYAVRRFDCGRTDTTEAGA